MNCSNCGHPLKDGKRFCSRCGAPVLLESSVPQTASFPQPNQQPDVQPYVQPYVQPVRQPYPPAKNHTPLIIAVVIVLCVALIAGAAVLVITRPWEKKLTQEEAFRQYEELLVDAKNEIEEFASDHEVPPISVVDINGSGMEDLVFVETASDGSVKVHVAIDRDGKIVRHTTENLRDFLLFRRRRDGSLYRFYPGDKSDVYCRIDPYTGRTIEKYVRNFEQTTNNYTYVYYPDGENQSQDDSLVKKTVEEFLQSLQNDNDVEVLITDQPRKVITDRGNDDWIVVPTGYDEAIVYIRTLHRATEDEKSNAGSDADGGSGKTDNKKTDEVQTDAPDKPDQEQTDAPDDADSDVGEEVYGAFAGNYIFSSGAGFWGSSLTLNSDGSFTGTYHDSNMGESGDGYQSTMYTSEFSGSFKNPRKINEYTYYFELDEISYDREPGDSEIRDDGNDHFTKVFFTEAHGLEEAGNGIYAYTADAPWSELPEGFINWSSAMISSNIENNRLGRKCLYVIEPEFPWFGEKE